ncbi:MAG TPA: glycosyltransferase, partial [Actinomycetota bacterium]
AAPVVLAVHDHRLDCPVGTRYWAAWKRACDIRPGPWCLAYNVAAHCGSLKANATLRPYVGWRAALRAARGLRIQVFSHAVRALMTKAGIDEAAVEVTPYPVPPLPLPRPPRNDDRRPVVLASGRITKEKGFAQLVDAVDRSGAAVHLVIAGEGHSRSSVERHAASAGGRHRITFTGWLDAADLAGWREAASVVAVPSMWPEPFGIVGLEAMAAGKPVVAFDTGGIREWLVDGETGALAPAGDVEAFGRALGALLADEARARAMGEAGRARAASVFALDAHVARVDELYRVVREAWRPDA